MVIMVLPCIMQATYRQCQQTILCISSHSFSEGLAVPEGALKSKGQASKPLLMLNTTVSHSVCDHFSSKREHAVICAVDKTPPLHLTICNNTSILEIFSWQWLAAEGAYGITWTAFQQLLGSRIGMTSLLPLVERESILKVTSGILRLAFNWWIWDN